MSDVNLSDLYDQLKSAVDAIDEKLDSQIDSEAAGKRKLTNELIELHEGTWKPVSESLIAQLADVPEDAKIGFYYGLVRAMNEAFNKPLTAALDKKVAEQPKVEIVPIPQEELDLLSKTRSDLYGKIKSLIEMAKNFGMDEGMEMPKKRTGKAGKRGPRAISFFSFEVDGKSYDTLKEVQDEYSSTYEKVSSLTKAIRESEYKGEKINLTTPPDRFEFTLPDGKILIATKDEEKVANPPVENDSDDGDDSDETEEETATEE